MSYFPNGIQVYRLMALAFCINSASAQQVVPVWGAETPPFEKPHTVVEYEAPCWGVTCAYQVVNPTLTLYTAEGAGSGVALVILPGGGYETEAVYHEGYEIAEALAESGIAAAVLKYRLPSPETSTLPERVPLSDVRQALKLLREGQAELGFSARRLGLLGFSAGSHLAATASVDRSPDPTENPDFSILVYGVTRMTPENREWLEKTLFHRNMKPEEVAGLTLLERVDEKTPPAFLVHALDDETCHFTESTLYAEALKSQGVEVELHLFAHGTDQWIALAANWMSRLGAGSGEREQE